MINKIGKKSKFEIKDIHHQGFCISVEIVNLYLCICNWIVILTIIMHGTENKLTAILRHFTIAWFYKDRVVMNQM